MFGAGFHYFSEINRYRSEINRYRSEINRYRSEINRRLKTFLRDQSGAVESALVLIPLMVLVLSVLQISMGTLSRIIANARTESVVTQSGLYGATGGTPLSTMSSLGLTSASAFTLSGGGTVYVGTQRTLLPSLTPLLPGGDEFTTVGVTLGEVP
jgi:hypothetical protein